jgi:hypothetical protein
MEVTPRVVAAGCLSAASAHGQVEWVDELDGHRTGRERDDEYESATRIWTPENVVKRAGSEKLGSK